MKEEDKKKYKKETAALFYNLNIKNNTKPIKAEIKLRNNKIKNMYNHMNTEIENFYISSSDTFIKNNIKFYRLYRTQYLSNGEKQQTKIRKKKKKIGLNSKIYFGEFINQNTQFDEMEDIKKYEKIKKLLSKSKNFSFVKNPKTIKFSKLPKELYSSKKYSTSLKKLNSVKNFEPFNQSSGINKAYDNSFHENNLYTNSKSDEEEKLNSKIYKIKQNNIIFFNNNKEDENKMNNFSMKLFKKLNKDKLSSKSVVSPFRKNLIEANSSIFISPKNKNLKNGEIEYLSLKDSPNYKNLAKKNNSYSNKSKIHNFYSNIDKSNCSNNSNSNCDNHSFNQSFYSTQKNFLLTKINEKLDKLSNYRTPKKEIKELNIKTNIKCKNKIKSIKKLIKKNTSYASRPHPIINLLTETKKKKNRKKIRNQFYQNLKNQARLLSIIDNLKNMNNNIPLNLIGHLNEDYKKKSKQMLIDNKFTNNINKIYKSLTEGKLLNEKVSSKYRFINRFANKNIMDLVDLKSKYNNCDLLLEKIKEENKPKNNKYIYFK